MFVGGSLGEDGHLVLLHCMLGSCCALPSLLRGICGVWVYYYCFCITTKYSVSVVDVPQMRINQNIFRHVIVRIHPNPSEERYCVCGWVAIKGILNG